ncbi:MAG: long-chain fatty acid--CoA ligase [Gammaproteobacteria bacterium]|nr:long-chain fatty acid--CoA ligase [Gammaproteobacteria bacterium]
MDVINTHDAHTLDQLFRVRVRRSSEKIAYSQYDHQAGHWFGVSWAEIAHRVERWQVAFKDQGLVKGERVAICYRNSIEWVVFDQAALRLGLIVVPLYTADRADNLAYIIADSRARLVLFESQPVWADVQACDEDVSCVGVVLVYKQTNDSDPRVKLIDSWLPEQGQHLDRGVVDRHDLASIVYTSGTTGRPKGVMLSHNNILSNAYGGMRSVALKPTDRLLSFLPLSHTLERTVGYYAAMLCGASVTFSRSITDLPDDLISVRPTVLVSVPRIFERIHNQIYQTLEDYNPLKRSLFKRAVKTGWHLFQYRQGFAGWHPRLLLTKLLDRLVARAVRDKLGGKLQFAVVGGAPLSKDVAKTFISLGVPLLQGYGLTEASPVISVNTKTRNRPESIGLPLRGVEVKLMDNDELWAKGDNVMIGYWGRPDDTGKVMSGEWLKTGDRAAIDDQGFIRIIGRIKDVLVMANGEKVAPADIEAAILRDSLFEQFMLVGEGRPYLTALAVLDKARWQQLCDQQQWDAAKPDSPEAQQVLLQRIDAQMQGFPGYARVRAVHASLQEWTVESGLLTPTLKIKRASVLDHFQTQVEKLYLGHGVHDGIN